MFCLSQEGQTAEYLGSASNLEHTVNEVEAVGRFINTTVTFGSNKVTNSKGILA